MENPTLREQIREAVATLTPKTFPVPGGEIVLTPKDDGSFTAEVKKDFSFSLELDDLDEAADFIGSETAGA